MTETKDTTEKTLQGGARKPLSLQRTVESGHVRQNFSHGRSKSVVVEKRRTRKLAAPGTAQDAEPELKEAKPAAPAPTKKPVKSDTAAPAQSSEAPGFRTLSDEERDARARALAAAKTQAGAEREEERAKAKHTAEAAPATTPAAAKVKPRSAARGETGAEGAPKSRSSLNPAFQPREGGRPREIDIPNAARAKPEPETPKRAARAAVAVTREDEESRGSPRGRKTGPRTPTVKTDERRERVKLTINNAFDEKQRERSLASLKRKREREKLKAMGIPQSREKIRAKW